MRALWSLRGCLKSPAYPVFPQPPFEGGAAVDPAAVVEAAVGGAEAHRAQSEQRPE